MIATKKRNKGLVAGRMRRLVRWLIGWRLVSRDQAIKAMDRLTDRDKGGARLTVRQYNRVLTDLGFWLDDPPDIEEIRYTGHVPCSKCGKVHWMYGNCPPNATAHPRQEPTPDNH